MSKNIRCHLDWFEIGCEELFLTPRKIVNLIMIRARHIL
jgi:hypothetical protein